jgi:hypothetical protein
MKVALILLLCSLPALAQDFATKFKEAESHAPKGYPTLFVVTTASVEPSTLFGNDGGCAMNLETLGQIYFVGVEPGFFSDQCKAFQPGTVLWGHLHRNVAAVVDVIDPSETKPKSRRYIVKNVTLVNPETQGGQQ